MLTQLQQCVPAEQLAFTNVFSYLDLKLLGKGLALDILVPRVGIFLYSICFLHQIHDFISLERRKLQDFVKTSLVIKCIKPHS